MHKISRPGAQARADTTTRDARTSTQKTTFAKSKVLYTSRHTHTQISRGLATAGTISTVGPASGGGVAEIIGGRS